jgi:hypothetical protein
MFNQDLDVTVPRGPRWPVALIVAGVVAIVVGSLGLTFGWGSTDGRPGVPTAESAASGSFAAPSTTTTSEQPAAFLASFVQALRSGDANFLVDRLDPAVIARYGTEQCRASVPRLFDSTAALTLRSTTGPAAFEYVTDGKSAAVQDVYSLEVDGIVGGQSATREYHVALVDGRFLIFFDCGDPLPGAP